MPLFAHPRLTADAYGAAVSRYFKSGIQVPIVIFADPSGREIAGTRLDHQQAQVKSTYLDHARTALDSFRGGQPAEKARETWKEFGRALALRDEGKDMAAAVESLQRIRDGAAKGSAMRVSVEEFLRRINDEEAAGFVELGRTDLATGDVESGLESLFTVLRDFPGLPARAQAEKLLAEAKKDPAKAATYAAVEKGSRAKEALRAGDRLARAGKPVEAKAEWEKVVKDFDGTPAALEAKERLEKK